jgi:hypothetical protein
MGPLANRFAGKRNCNFLSPVQRGNILLRFRVFQGISEPRALIQAEMNRFLDSACLKKTVYL